ncbi:protein trapped in endoderm-1 [Eurytemora carolleeae]|uniref:protein trapped in endoderm-1 n=1 Tax=Eurytemora carolleeae TaxID=1294199 RepID=UPI000C76E885|nr:protein trapped in endoderm-1 [Eurytemora carolleeae]|eukprot:XP_023343199.1 protein trapped in endoderm-1-like [Eurytemora affinis]
MSRPSYEDGTAILFSELESRVTGVVACICSVLGVVGNLVTIGALLNSKKLRSHPTTLFLISLALSDLIFGGYNLPLTAHRFFHRGCEFMCLDYHVCRYFPFFFYGNLGVSIYIMSIIAIYRVFGVFNGHVLNTVFNTRTVPLMILGVWILVFGTLTLPLTEHWGQFGFESQTFSCTIVESEGETFMPAMTILGIVLPCCFISISYISIYWRVRFTGNATRKASRYGHEEEDQNNFDYHKHIKERERELTRTLLYIFLGFVICFLPFCILTVADPMPPSKNSVLHLLSYILTWTSCFINPFIYCVTNKYYYEAYKNMFVDLLRLCSVPGSRVQPVTNTTGVSNQSSTLKEQDLVELENLFNRRRNSSEIIETTRL